MSINDKTTKLKSLFFNNFICINLFHMEDNSFAIL